MNSTLDYSRRLPLGLGSSPAQIEIPPGRWAEEERVERQRRVNDLGQACGCAEGAAASVIGVGLFSIYVWVSPAISGIRALLIGALVFIGTGAAGKVLGLLLSRRRHRRELALLAAELRDHVAIVTGGYNMDR